MISTENVIASSAKTKEATPAYVVPYSKAEDLANALSHGLGIILGVIGLILMMQLAVEQSHTVKLISAIIYGVSIILLFMTSTFYHSFKQPQTKRLWKIFDHCAIYLLIAGTYTPFLLISLAGDWSFWSMSIIWTLALFGIFFKIFFQHRFPKISLFTYLFMGWLMVAAGAEFIETVSTEGLLLLALGGLLYTVGAIFYVWKKLPFNHAIWHVFVLIAAVSHFFSIYLFVLPEA